MWHESTDKNITNAELVALSDALFKGITNEDLEKNVDNIASSADVNTEQAKALLLAQRNQQIVEFTSADLQAIDEDMLMSTDAVNSLLNREKAIEIATQVDDSSVFDFLDNQETLHTEQHNKSIKDNKLASKLARLDVIIKKLNS